MGFLTVEVMPTTVTKQLLILADGNKQAFTISFTELLKILLKFVIDLRGNMDMGHTISVSGMCLPVAQINSV